VITEGTRLASPVTMNEDEQIVLESSLEGSALAIILSPCSSRSDDTDGGGGGSGRDGRRSSIASACTVGATVNVLYLDTCCLCHSCSSRVISLLNEIGIPRYRRDFEIDITASVQSMSSRWMYCSDRLDRMSLCSAHSSIADDEDLEPLAEALFKLNEKKMKKRSNFEHRMNRPLA
jgi:hypothetical protein